MPITIPMTVTATKTTIPASLGAAIVAGAGSVYSVNGMTGDVVLTAEDVGAATAEQGLPMNGNQGDVLMNSGGGEAVWVAPASSVEEDNTRPITSAAVFVEVGNINALLATI